MSPSNGEPGQPDPIGSLEFVTMFAWGCTGSGLMLAYNAYLGFVPVPHALGGLAVLSLSLAVCITAAYLHFRSTAQGVIA